MSNLIFSRRAVQQSIDRLARILPVLQLSRTVTDLNKPTAQRIPIMWEIVVLDALSGFGQLKYEEPLSTGRKPDFSLAISLPAEYLIIGDIATVSDCGLEEKNPVDDLGEAITRIARKAKLDPHHFSIKIFDDVRTSSGGVKLHLPSAGELAALLNLTVLPWMRQLASSECGIGPLRVREPQASFDIEYQPGQRYRSFGHSYFKGASTLAKNALFAMLKRKADQLSGSAPSAIRMIVACDGDCALFDVGASGTSRINAGDVARDFLRQNRSIDIVGLIQIEEIREFGISVASRRIRYQVFSQQNVPKLEVDRTRKILMAKGLLEAALAKLPVPQRTAQNAVARSLIPGVGPDMIGGGEMGSSHVKLSLRALQRLLAGTLSLDEFLAAYEWNGASHPNPFRRALRQGKMIRRIDVEGAGDADDDWVTFRFGDKDPAVASFALPSTDNAQSKAAK